MKVHHLQLVLKMDTETIIGLGLIKKLSQKSKDLGVETTS